MVYPPLTLTRKILQKALSLGFSSAGVAPAHSLDQDEKALEDWLAAGKHGGMSYMAREPHRRSHPQVILPEARSLLVLAMNYKPSVSPQAISSKRSGRISRYAWGEDYHALIEDRLAHLETTIREVGGKEVVCRSYVDHGPVLEKAMARQAGIGFIGKNTLLITEKAGSWVFLAVILTSLELEPDQPRSSDCGSCSLCLDACPTGALTAPFQLDARRCISYLTIENKGEIPGEFKSQMNHWLFGCDICQEVCPYNEHTHATEISEFHPDYGAGPTLDLEEVMKLDSDKVFRAKFKKSPLLRAKRLGLQRNARMLQEPS